MVDLCQQVAAELQIRGSDPNTRQEFKGRFVSAINDGSLMVALHKVNPSSRVLISTNLTEATASPQANILGSDSSDNDLGVGAIIGITFGSLIAVGAVLSVLVSRSRRGTRRNDDDKYVYRVAQTDNNDLLLPMGSDSRQVYGPQLENLIPLNSYGLAEEGSTVSSSIYINQQSKKVLKGPESSQDGGMYIDTPAISGPARYVPETEYDYETNVDRAATAFGAAEATNAFDKVSDLYQTPTNDGKDSGNVSESYEFDSESKSSSEGNPDSDSNSDNDDEIVEPGPTIRNSPHSYTPKDTVQQDIQFTPQSDDRSFGVITTGLGLSSASVTGVTHSIREMTDEDNSSSNFVDSMASEYSSDSIEESDNKVLGPTDPHRFRVHSGFSSVDQSKVSTIDSIDNDGTFPTTPLQGQTPQESHVGQISTQAINEAFAIAAARQDSDDDSTSSGSYETASDNSVSDSDSESDSDSDSDSGDMEMSSDCEKGAFPEHRWPSSALPSTSNEPDSSIDYSKSVSDDTLSTSLASQSYTQIVASSAISANAEDLRCLPLPRSEPESKLEKWMESPAIGDLKNGSGMIAGVTALGAAKNSAGVGLNDDASGGSSYSSAEASSYSDYSENVKTLKAKEIDEPFKTLHSTKPSVNHPGTDTFSDVKNIHSLGQPPRQISSQASPDSYLRKDGEMIVAVEGVAGVGGGVGIVSHRKYDGETDTSEVESMDSVDESVDDVSLDEDDEIMLARATTPTTGLDQLNNGYPLSSCFAGSIAVSESEGDIELSDNSSVHKSDFSDTRDRKSVV